MLTKKAISMTCAVLLIILLILIVVLVVFSRDFNIEDCTGMYKVRHSNQALIEAGTAYRFEVQTAEISSTNNTYFHHKCHTEWFFSYADSISGLKVQTLKHEHIDPDKHFATVIYDGFIDGVQLVSHELEIYNIMINDSGIYKLFVRAQNTADDQLLAALPLSVNASKVKHDFFVMDSQLLRKVQPQHLQFGKKYAIVCKGEDSPELPQISLYNLKCTGNDVNRSCGRDVEIRDSFLETKNGTFDRSKVLYINATRRFDYSCVVSRNACNSSRTSICKQNSTIHLLVSDIEESEKNKGFVALVNNHTIGKEQNGTRTKITFQKDDYFNYTCKVQRHIYDKNVTMEARLDNGTTIHGNYKNIIRKSTQFSYTTTWAIGRLSDQLSGVYSCTASRSYDAPIGVPLELRHEVHILVLSTFPQILTGILCGLLFVLCTLLVAYLIYQRQKHKKFKKISTEEDGLIEAETLEPEILTQYLIPAKRIKNIKNGRVLGNGQFGKVLEATVVYGDSSLTVAAKVPADIQTRDQLKSLRDEILVMSKNGYHPNILGLIGVVKEDDIFAVIVEFCALGSILKYIRDRSGAFLDEIETEVTTPGYMLPWQTARTIYKSETQRNWSEDVAKMTKGNMLTTSQLLAYCYQTANGMHFLSEQKFIHRDLAARNLLLTLNHTVKIADYGLAKNKEEYQVQRPHEAMLPLATMALESFRDHTFTLKTDIWSFGVVVWEIFSFGETPYNNLVSLDFMNISVFLAKGNRLKKPSHSPNEIYRLMRQCWDENPEGRPSFYECREIIEEELKRCSKPTLDEVKQKISVEEQERIIKNYMYFFEITIFRSANLLPK